jgi:hypothetical protein
MTSNEKGKKYLILTCDTEALPKEATEAHVERLIWGQFPEAPAEAGIGLMMDLADQFGAKITFFLDVLERLAYGGEIDQVARNILHRGHDLQLHLHIEFLSPNFWNSLGYQHPTWAMNLFDLQAARFLLDYGIGLFREMAGVSPLAYRAGAFRYNSFILQALGEFGIPLSFQYYPSTALKQNYPYGFDAGPLPIFRWSNGIIEVPCGVYETPHPRRSAPRYIGFEFQQLTSMERFRNIMERCWANGPEFNVLVMVLHSWSFLGRNEAGQFTWQGDGRAKFFREILASLPSDVEVISASNLLQKVRMGEIQPAFEMPLPVAGTDGICLFPLPKASTPKQVAA